MAQQGRPSKFTEVDVLEFIERGARPYATAAHIADEFDCSPETARRRLRSLTDRDVLEVDDTSRTQIWYRPETSTEVVKFFDDRNLLVLIGAREDTLSAAEEFCEALASTGDCRILKWNNRTVQLKDCTSEADVRNRAKEVCDDPRFLDSIVDRWWSGADVLAYTNDNGDAVIQTQYPKKHEAVRAVIDDENIEAIDDTRTKIRDDVVVPVLQEISDNFSLRDRRNPQMKRREVLQPVFNGEVDGVSFYFDVIGVDSGLSVHVYDETDESIKVIDRQEVVHSEQIADKITGIQRWVEFIEEDEGRGWKELQQVGL
jgi:hypothetical protein